MLPADIARRTFLQRSGVSVGSMALANLMANRAGSGANAAESTQASAGLISQGLASQGVINPLHFPPQAKRVIWLYMAGGMSHLDTYDHKPKLAELSGQPMPESFTKGQQIAQLQGKQLKCFAPQYPFQKYGSSGQELSSLCPHLGEKCADDLCIVRSMYTDAINHDPAHTLMNTGTMVAGRPAMGSWCQYGLGAETENLPGFVVMVSTGNFGQKQPIAARQWHSGFLPSRFQGVEFRSTGAPVLYVNRPPGVTAAQQRDVVDAVARMNSIEESISADPEIATRISQYEMAFKMQSSVPELMDVSDEPQHVLDLYGTQGGDGSFAANCLLARRLAERGVRFIQLYHRD